MFVYLALKGNSRRNVKYKAPHIRRNAKYKATNTLMPRTSFQFPCIRGT